MDDALHIAEQRALIYEWLAGLFAAALPAAHVASYQRGAGADFLAALAEDRELRPGIDRMRDALPADRSADEIAAVLGRAFANLFLGAGGNDALPPYESAHVSDRGLLFQEATAEMDQLLRGLGMSVEAACKEPADHLSVELAAQAHLVRRRASIDASAPPLAEAARDLLDRLLAWVPIFSARCIVLDATGFYAGAAMALTAFLAEERFQSTSATVRYATVPYDALDGSFS
jgi:TorA-specific chaperone